jgi:hypothetical protein
MGLTIHYRLHSDVPTAGDARTLISDLQRRAGELPFNQVGEIVEFDGENCDFRNVPKGQPNRWLLVQARQLQKLDEEGEQWAEVTPIRVIAFTVHPAEGSEPANFGLCRYPETIVIDGHRKRTGLSGWRWASFCKTQYASNPDLGGFRNILRAHIGVIGLLDNAEKLGILGSVSDESGFAEKRAVKALIEEVGNWNQMIAGFYGGMKDAVSAAGADTRALVAEIARFPNFEHLEAEDRFKRQT